MRNRHAFLAGTTTMALAILLSPCIWGQESRTSAGRDDKNRPEKQEQKSQSASSETIRGVVAGITAEGEVIYDYKNNRAIAAEGAFLTIVGSPMKSEKSGSEPAKKARSDEKSGDSGRGRHNVYIAWLTPRTKVCECKEESGASKTGQGSGKSEKKECGLDKLEVGDHVEIQFEPRDASNEGGVAHQSDRMREKHGRHRTYVGSATEVTILMPAEAEHDRSGSKEKDKESK